MLVKMLKASLLKLKKEILTNMEFTSQLSLWNQPLHWKSSLWLLLSLEEVYKQFYQRRNRLFGRLSHHKPNNF